LCRILRTPKEEEMPAVLPLDAYEVLEEGLGKEGARKLVKALEVTISEAIEHRWTTTKEELLDAIRKDFITRNVFKEKMDAFEEKLNVLRTELLGKMEKDKAELLGKIEKDKAELLGKMEKEKTELLGKMEKDKAELLGKIEALYEKTEKDKAELLGKIEALYEKTEKDKAELLGKIEALYEKTEKDKAELKGRMDRLEQKFKFMMILLILALTVMNPVVAEILKRLLKLG
jgi:hypothetical protein